MKKFSRKTRRTAIVVLNEFYYGQINASYASPMLFVNKKVVSSIEEANRLFRVLQGLEYARPYKIGNTEYMALTPKGDCYFEAETDEKRSFWMRSILIPFLVSIIIACITTYLMPGKQTLTEGIQGYESQVALRISQAPRDTHEPQETTTSHPTLLQGEISPLNRIDLPE